MRPTKSLKKISKEFQENFYDLGFLVFTHLNCPCDVSFITEQISLS
jgi:hypothetical protein